MNDKVKITINGEQVEAPKGMLLIEHLLKNGIDIPHFCYHPTLGKDGNCRMCMVEIEGSKRPQIACDTPIKEGMSIHTNSDMIKQVRKDILELELINHPIDCPTCDQAGECKLQDYYMQTELHESRMDVENKNHARKNVDLGKNVMLDQERCVLCTRCIRFTQKITNTNELGVINRGDRSVIDTFHGRELESNYSMNIVDLCPVGALTSKDFRFNQRVWFLESFEAICGACSRGCNINVDHRKEKYKDDKIFRFRPVVNLDVNGYFICDEGRLSYKNEAINRLENAYTQGKECSMGNAIKSMREWIASNKNKTLFLVSPHLSNEELQTIQIFAKEHEIPLSGYSPQYINESLADDMLHTADSSPNRAGMQKLGISQDEKFFKKELDDARLVVVFENSYFDANSGLLGDKKSACLFSVRPNDLEQFDIVIPLPSFLEKDGTYTNCDGIEQKFITGMQKNRPLEGLVDIFKESL